MTHASMRETIDLHELKGAAYVSRFPSDARSAASIRSPSVTASGSNGS